MKSEGTVAKTIVCVIFALFLLVALYKSKSSNTQVMERLFQEKNSNRLIRKRNLAPFFTKIVTHVKASPLDFVKVLSNPVFWKNFKFDIPIPEGTQPDLKKAEHIQR
jgi:hypothetical protein